MAFNTGAGFKAMQFQCDDFYGQIIYWDAQKHIKEILRREVRIKTNLVVNNFVKHEGQTAPDRHLIRELIAYW